MKALIIGYGSIGSRHARILQELGCDVSVVSQRDVEFSPSYKNLSNALEKEQPDYVVIANKTSEHYQRLYELNDLGFKGIVLVEKPLFQEKQELSRFSFQQVFVAYNLRFHPILQKLKSILASQKICSVQIYVGQYLPSWRPQSDYRQSYSACKAEGGGVLRDLSHELDYVQWLFGKVIRLNALGGHYSSLEIDSDDVFALLLESEQCPVLSLQMNYLDRAGRREILINTHTQTIKADLVQGTLTVSHDAEHSEVEHFQVGRDDTYRTQHQMILEQKFESLCSLEEGLEVLSVIEQAEASAHQHKGKVQYGSNLRKHSSL